MTQDQESNETLYLKYARQWYVRTFILIGTFCLLLLLLLAAVLWGRGRREVINCAVLGTQVKAMVYSKLHPRNAYKLDTNQNGIPCENYPIW